MGSSSRQQRGQQSHGQHGSTASSGTRGGSSHMGSSAAGTTEQQRAHRSTSPPKSACPGVSTALMVWPLYCAAVWQQGSQYGPQTKDRTQMLVKGQGMRPTAPEGLFNFNMHTLDRENRQRKFQLFQPHTWKDVYLDEMVMPRSFSNSLLSITRSSLQGINWYLYGRTCTSVLDAFGDSRDHVNIAISSGGVAGASSSGAHVSVAPVWFSSRSIRVVLPWSTCAAQGRRERDGCATQRRRQAAAAAAHAWRPATLGPAAGAALATVLHL